MPVWISCISSWEKVETTNNIGLLGIIVVVIIAGRLRVGISGGRDVKPVS
jgi:hypothetical protein